MIYENLPEKLEYTGEFGSEIVLFIPFLRFLNKKDSFKTIEIHFSKKILDNALAILREYHCFKIWIPSIIKSRKIEDQAISLDFHMGDNGG